MAGAVITIERPILRTGLRDSPAKMATYSKPLSAPKVILLKTLSVKTVSGGATRRSGWNDDKVPRQALTKGRATRTATVMRTATLPALLNHLPTRKPIAARTTCAAIKTNEAAHTAHLFSAIQLAEGNE